MSSYPNAIVRQRCTPSKPSKHDTIEKTPRRLFETSANEEDTKKTLFKNYRERSLEDSFNDSIASTTTLPTMSDFSFNDNPYNSPGFKERNLKLADVDKGLEVIGRGLAKDQRISWREYWSFLNEFLDIGSNEGLNKFENYLHERLIERNQSISIAQRKFNVMTSPVTPILKNAQSKFKTHTQPNSDDQIKTPTLSIAQQKLKLAPLPITPISKISEKLNKFHIEKDQLEDNFNHNRPTTPSSPNVFHAYMCVEKSCQIYANRLLKPIAQNPTNIATVNDVLVGELNRLRSLIFSYKQDVRFFAVDFEATHSRFAHIVVALLNSEQEYQEHNVSETLRNTLTLILQAKEKCALNTSKNGLGQDEHSKNITQLICLLKYLLKRLKDSSNLIPPEVLTTEIDCADMWRDEEKCDCEWINAAATKVNRHIQRKTQRLSDSFGEFCDKLKVKSENTEQKDDDLFLVILILNIFN